MTIYEIIQSVVDIGSTITKQKIIEGNKDNETLKKCFFYAENPRFNYYIKIKSLPVNSGKNDINELSFIVLDTLISRKLTGGAAREFVENFMETLTVEAQEIFARIINRDLRCNAGTAIANKVWKNLIPEYPVLLCDKFNQKTEKHLKKYENTVGFFCECLSDSWKVEFENGTILTIGEIVKNKISGKVKSYNEETKKVEFNEIVNWFNNGLSSENWYTITYEENGVVSTTKELTGNHKLLTDVGWVSVDQLSTEHSLL